MEEFASAAMMRLVAAGLARQGLAHPERRAFPGAWVEISTKRNALGEVMAVFGPLAILRIGEAVQDVRGEPVLAAFETAADPHDLIDRWRRLERFAHSHHRVQVVEASEAAFTLHHVSPKSDEPPRPEEDLLILGALIGLMREIGVADLRAKMEGEANWSYRSEWLNAPNDLSESALWRFEWTGRASANATTPDLSKLAKVLARDLSKRWSVSEAARTLGLSARSLQRALAADGRTFSEIVAETRAAAAVRLLSDEALSLGQIGFVCGYADQAHFTRSFRMAMAATPGEFRDELTSGRR